MLTRELWLWSHEAIEALFCVILGWNYIATGQRTNMLACHHPNERQVAKGY